MPSCSSNPDPRPYFRPNKCLLGKCEGYPSGIFCSQNERYQLWEFVRGEGGGGVCPALTLHGISDQYL